jgi:hypothetical protein
MIPEAGTAARAGWMVQTVARWGLLLILIGAPWAYGATRFWTMELLNDSCFVCLALYLLGLALERRLPPWPLVPVACFALLLVESGWMAFNARSDHDAVYSEFVPLMAPFPALPGSWDRAATLFYLQRQLAMAAIFLVAVDTVPRLRWKRAVCFVIAWTGASIAVFGMAQHVLKAPSIFWLPENTGHTFFGGFRYHGNAGAFLNLVWPMLLLGTIRSFWTPQAHFSRAAGIAGLFLTLAGCAVNVSRAAAGLTLFLLVFGGLGLVPILRRRGMIFPFWKIALGVGLALIFVGTMFFDGVASGASARWEGSDFYQGEVNIQQRLLAYDASLRMLPEAGWFGYGAGTFSAVFPEHTAYLGGRLVGFFKFAHEDYLQTVIEYGYLGAALWGTLLFGSIGRAVFRACDATLRTSDRLTYAICVIALAGVSLHSLGDFPLQIASIQLYVMIFFALAWAPPTGEPRGSVEPAASFQDASATFGRDPRTSAAER